MSFFLIVHLSAKARIASYVHVYSTYNYFIRSNIYMLGKWKAICIIFALVFNDLGIRCHLLNSCNVSIKYFQPHEFLLNASRSSTISNKKDQIDVLWCLHFSPFFRINISPRFNLFQQLSNEVSNCAWVIADLSQKYLFKSFLFHWIFGFTSSSLPEF